MKKTLIALAAAGTLALGLSGSANANGIYFGVGGWGQPHFGLSYGYPGYYGAGYGYGDGCGPHWVKTWRFDPWVGHKVPVMKKVWNCY